MVTTACPNGGKEAVRMQWAEVRKLYPSQFVYLEDLRSHVDDGRLHVEEVAIIRPLGNSRDAWDAFKSAKDRRFIYHTSREDIVMPVVAKPLVRGLEP
jgi:hypothetical protein